MTPRSNLSDFIKARCIAAARAALGGGGDVEEAIAQRLVDDVLRSPAVRLRVKNAGPQERAKVAKEIPEFVRELKEMGFAPPSVLIPQRPDKMNVEPQAVKAMLHEASAAVIAQADEALAVTAASVGCEPPAQSDLAAWIGAGHCPPETLDEVTKRLAVLWGLDPGQVRVAGWALGGLVTWRDGVELHVPASDLLASARQRNIRNPLGPLVAACPVATAPGRHDRPIIPAIFGERIQPPLFHLPTPELPGQTRLGDTAYLPGLEPEAPPAPALLLAMFDDAGGASLTQNGRVSAAASIWLEAMLDLPPDKRDGSLRETRYCIREIAGDWLGWNLRNYRRTGMYTGKALARALRDVRDLWVPMNDRGGGYFPVMVSAWSGWGLDDRLGFVVRLPRGHVGPQIDRALLRGLRDSGPAYRLYLSLCFEWDKYGGHKGKLIRPSRPKVRRNGGGQVVDASGRVLTGPGNQPIYTPYDKRAILTGEREPNPARSRYPEYTPDDLVALAFPGHIFADKTSRWLLRHRAVKTLPRLELAGVVVERLGTDRHPLFRVMPPDPPEFEALPPGSAV